MKNQIKIIEMLMLTLCLQGCGNAKSMENISVITATAQTKQLESNIDIAGVLVPNKTEAITTKLGGFVNGTNAEVGDTVSAGQLLLTIDTKELNAQLQQAEAAYNTAVDQASLAKVNMDAAQSGLSVTQEQIADQISSAILNLDTAREALAATEKQSSEQLAQAQLAVDNAQQAFDRKQRLFEASIIAQAEMETAQNSLDMAKSQYSLVEASVKSALLAAQSKVDAAKNQYDQVAGSGSKGQTIAAQSKYDTAKKQYEVSSSSGVNQSQAAIDSIRVQLSNAQVSTGIGGVVVNKNISVGEMAVVGSTLYTVADMSTLRLKATVPQEAVPFIQKGQKMNVIVDIYLNRTFTGTVESVGPIAVSTGSYFPLEISLPNEGGDITAGLSAHAAISITSSENLVVPSSAVVENSGQSYLFVIENGVAHKRNVVVGLKSSDETEILSGVAQGETVAVSNANTLFDNMPVNAR